MAWMFTPLKELQIVNYQQKPQRINNDILKEYMILHKCYNIFAYFRLISY